ncbi:DUF3343 domain-containing protein [uncultured Flavonifractor sp.]|uniref:DUF3343 domain-containing protein n=1 Tax=uncultured Flavonifractor sp. TaxID=1193534 RepID=UPI00261F4B30|nr:DUF3343 domain-containing protein [uncultured Flavonifractor sp.]
MVYIATFYSHFGAMRFKKDCERQGVEARLMPVPRDLSSSCGTCVRYGGEYPCPAGGWPEEMEQAVAVTEGGYRPLYRADRS